MQFKLFLAALILFAMVSILPISAEEFSGDGYRIASAKHVKVYAESGRFGGWPANHGLTIYYFHDTPQSERYIAATLWDPNG